MGRRVTAENLPRALRSLRADMAALDTRTVSVPDDTFTLSKRRVLEFCGALTRGGFDLSFSIFAGADTLDEEINGALAAAGCSRVFVGMDAGDDQVLQKISKGFSVEESVPALRAASRHFELVASFIWSFPFESREAFERTLDMARGLAAWEGAHRIVPQLHLLSPSVATLLFDKYQGSLVFDPSASNMLIGGAADAYRTLQSERAVLDLIRSDKTLGAPFHRYETPGFEHKAEVVREFMAKLRERAAAEVINLLANENAETQLEVLL